jgi:hypothetical protein
MVFGERRYEMKDHQSLFVCNVRRFRMLLSDVLRRQLGLQDKASPIVVFAYYQSNKAICVDGIIYICG